MNLKNKLNHLKQVKKSTSKDIMSETKISKGTLDKILTGVTSTPRTDAILLLSKYFDVTSDYLIDDDISVCDIRYKNLEQDQLLKSYSNLSEDKKNIVIGYINRLLDEN